MEIIEKRNPLPWIIVVLLLVCVISLGFMLHQTQDKLSEAEFRILQLESQVYGLSQQQDNESPNELIEANEAKEAKENDEDFGDFMRKYGANPDGSPINPNEGMEGTPYAERDYGSKEAEEESSRSSSRVLEKYGFYSDTSGDNISPDGSPLAEDRYLTHDQQLAIENGQ